MNVMPRGHIASIGSVNVTTAKNQMFGTMWECWEEGYGTDILFERNGKFRAVHTSEGFDIARTRYTIGSYWQLIGDQSRRHLGDWKIVDCRPHTAPGILEFKKVTGTSRIDFATFK